jgi:dipeptidyl aminopeptidase/acylaminoacyl peptidase
MRMDRFAPERLVRLVQATALEGSPDGERLLLTVEAAARDGKGLQTSLWELPIGQEIPPRQILDCVPGRVQARYVSAGQLALVARPSIQDGNAHGPSALWLLDLRSGETAIVAKASGGVDGVAVAQSGAALASMAVHKDARDLGEDRHIDQAWRELGSSGLLFDGYPIARLDRYLVPHERHLYLVDMVGATVVRDLTPLPGLSLVDSSFDIAADGTWMVVTRNLADGVRNFIERADIASTTAMRLTHDAARYSQLRVSPDGNWLACIRENVRSGRAPRMVLHLLDAQTGKTVASTVALDAWPSGPVWSPDADAVFFVAPIDGVVTAHRLTLGTGHIARIPTNQSVESLTLAGPTRDVPYGLTSSLVSPPRPVAIGVRPGRPPRGWSGWNKGRATGPRCVLERIITASRDGSQVHSWLVRRSGSTARQPLLVLLHGGPFGAWTYWRRRLNAPLFADAGYAVLLPEPAPSVGFGQNHVQRGWRDWTRKPVDDVVAAIEGCRNRDDVDVDRIGLLGVSFGGYLATWIASVMPEQFRALVVHAGIWDLRSFSATTDLTTEWSRYLGEPASATARHEQMSPRRNVGQLRLPILLTHGVRDLRVPVSQAFYAYSDLWRYADGCELLLFPDEGHTIGQPQNLVRWYREVVSLFDRHVAYDPRAEGRSHPDGQT